MKKILLILTALVFLCSAGTAFAESGASATYRRLSEQILRVMLSPVFCSTAPAGASGEKRIWPPV